MSEAAAIASPKAAKRKSSKTVLASVLVLVLLAAFGSAFYAFGGVGIVSPWVDKAVGILSGPSPAQSPAPTGAPAAAVDASSSAAATTAPASGYPPGVDEPFAKRVYVEQVESESNIQKLVDGKISSMTFGKVSNIPGGREVAITITAVDKTSIGGVLGLARRGSDWYFVYVAGDRTSHEGFGEDPAGDELASKTVDADVMHTVMQQQAAAQDVVRGIADGTFARASFDGVSPGSGTATLHMTLVPKRGAVVKGDVLCIRKDIDGAATWFVTSFSKV